MQTITDSKRDCQNCQLNGVCSACDHVTHFMLKRKELLFFYRDAFKGVYSVKSGCVKTLYVDGNGNERIFDFYLPGEIVGLEAIHPGFYPGTAMAITPTEVCLLTYDDLQRAIANESAISHTIFRAMSFRLNQGAYTTAPTPEQRLAAFLLDMAKRLNAATNNNKMTLPMSRFDIGYYLSLAPETVSRTIAKFQQLNLVEANNKDILFKDLSSLRWVAEDGFAN